MSGWPAVNRGPATPRWPGGRTHGKPSVRSAREVRRRSPRRRRHALRPGPRRVRRLQLVPQGAAAARRHLRDAGRHARRGAEDARAARRRRRHRAAARVAGDGPAGQNPRRLPQGRRRDARQPRRRPHARAAGRLRRAHPAGARQPQAAAAGHPRPRRADRQAQGGDRGDQEEDPQHRQLRGEGRPAPRPHCHGLPGEARRLRREGLRIVSQTNLYDALLPGFRVWVLFNS